MNVKDLIPQREPFLFIEEILEVSPEEITVSQKFYESMDFFKGHFPENPIVPGVILTEHCFQSGAALIATKNTGMKASLAVVTRIQSAKFKNIVKPNEIITTKTKLIEMMGQTAFFKSIALNEAGKKVLILEFACTLVGE